MSRTIDSMQICSGFLPVDMSSAANAGDWVNLKDYESCLVVLAKAVGTAGDDPTITLLQATSAAGGSSKALNFTRIYVKMGTLTSVANYTEVIQTAANTYTDATSAEAAAIWVIEITPDMCDVGGGFTFIQASVADVGTNAQLGALLYILSKPRYATAPASLPSAIA